MAKKNYVGNHIMNLTFERWVVIIQLKLSFTHPKVWRAFLKRPENLSGPKTFRGSFRVNFSGPGKRFSTRPKTPRILTRVFRVVFSGLQRELDSDLLRTLIDTAALSWVPHVRSTYATNQTFFRRLFRRITGKLLTLPFICTVSTPLAVL